MRGEECIPRVDSQMAQIHLAFLEERNQIGELLGIPAVPALHIIVELSEVVRVESRRNSGDMLERLISIRGGEVIHCQTFLEHLRCRHKYDVRMIYD